jgi:hypothetical protein
MSSKNVWAQSLDTWNVELPPSASETTGGAVARHSHAEVLPHVGANWLRLSPRIAAHKRLVSGFVPHLPAHLRPFGFVRTKAPSRRWLHAPVVRWLCSPLSAHLLSANPCKSLTHQAVRCEWLRSSRCACGRSHGGFVSQSELRGCAFGFVRAAVIAGPAEWLCSAPRFSVASFGKPASGPPPLIHLSKSRSQERRRPLRAARARLPFGPEGIVTGKDADSSAKLGLCSKAPKEAPVPWTPVSEVFRRSGCWWGSYILVCLLEQRDPGLREYAQDPA